MDSNKLKRLQFAKQLQMFAEVVTDKGTLIYEGDLIEGVEVLIMDENGELVVPQNGDYIVENKIYTVTNGVVEKITEKEVEEEQAPEIDVEVEDTTAKDAEIEKLRAENEQLKAEILAKDAEIENLKKELQKSVDEPVDVTIKEEMSEAEQKHQNIVAALRKH